jgi:hypothetical protein
VELLVAVVAGWVSLAVQTQFHSSAALPDSMVKLLECLRLCLEAESSSPLDRPYFTAFITTLDISRYAAYAVEHGISIWPAVISFGHSCSDGMGRSHYGRDAGTGDPAASGLLVAV